MPIPFPHSTAQLEVVWLNRLTDLCLIQTQIKLGVLYWLIRSINHSDSVLAQAQALPCHLGLQIESQCSTLVPEAIALIRSRAYDDWVSEIWNRCFYGFIRFDHLANGASAFSPSNDSICFVVFAMVRLCFYFSALGLGESFSHLIFIWLLLLCSRRCPSKSLCFYCFRKDMRGWVFAHRPRATERE